MAYTCRLITRNVGFRYQLLHHTNFGQRSFTNQRIFDSLNENKTLSNQIDEAWRFRGHNLASPHRCIHTSSFLGDKSKLEDSLKEKIKKKNQEAVNIETAAKTEVTAETKPPSTEVQVPKKSLWARFVAEVRHYFNGFRLLGLDAKIAAKTLWKFLNGQPVIRRERNQFRRAVADIFRLAPFSVFIIIPFAEFALPVALKLFPNMLPSTFETLTKRDARLKKELKVKLEMAKFLQDTVEDITVRTKKSSNKNDAAQDFVSFFHKIRTTNEEPTNEEIIKHAKLFENQLTLDNLQREQLVALCRLIQVSVVGTNDVLRLLLQMKLNRLQSDDKMIQQEGVDSLTTTELMAACQSRGMRALGVSRSRLKQQLVEWIDLHLNHDVPSSLLLLSRILYMPEDVSPEVRVKAAISTLPEKAAGVAEIRASELNLERVDNTTLYKVAKLEDVDIAVEKAKETEKTKPAEETEKVKEDVKSDDKTEVVTEKKAESEEVLDEGPVVQDTSRVITDDNKITQDDIDILSAAIKQNTEESKEVSSAKSDLKDLREDVEEYEKDVESLHTELRSEKDEVVSQDMKAGKRIQKRVNKLIGQLDKLVEDLDKQEAACMDQDKDCKQRGIRIHTLVESVQSLKEIPEDKLLKIFDILDTNKDGIVDVEEAGTIIEILNQEHMEVNESQLQNIVKLLETEKEKETLSKKS